MITEIDIAWAAGLFEGEGSVYLARTQKNRPVIELSSTDKDVVEKFATIVDVGHIYEFKRGDYKPGLRWVTSKKDDVEKVLNMFMSYLGKRRKIAAIEVLEKCKSINSRLDDNDKLELLKSAGLR